MYRMNETNLKDNFSQIQRELNITPQAFQQQFVFGSLPDPYGSRHKYFLPIEYQTPSRQHGITAQQEAILAYLATDIIFNACKCLRLPVSAAIVAMQFTHYFYSKKSYMDIDFRNIVMAAVFLACKCQETPRMTGHVAVVFDHLFKIYEGVKKPVPVLQASSECYKNFKRTILSYQNKLLFCLGFDVHLLIDIPHRYISGMLKMFDRHPQCKAIAKQTWSNLNDVYRTRLCLYYPGPSIAAASIYLSLRLLAIPMPTCPWWVLFQSSYDTIVSISAKLYTGLKFVKEHKISMIEAQEILGAVGKVHGFCNVFAVPYYRKVIQRDYDMLKPQKLDQQEEKDTKQKNQRKRIKKNEKINRESKEKKSKEENDRNYEPSDHQTPKVLDVKKLLNEAHAKKSQQSIFNRLSKTEKNQANHERKKANNLVSNLKKLDLSQLNQKLNSKLQKHQKNKKQQSDSEEEDLAFLKQKMKKNRAAQEQQ